jgi:hypothetical protein
LTTAGGDHEEESNFVDTDGSGKYLC